MKPILFSVAALALAATAFADDVPLDKAQEGARKLNESLGQVGDLPLLTSADLEKPQAIKSGEVGLMVVPDQALSGTVVSDARESIVPLGQLWTLNLVLAKDGKATSSSEQRSVTLRAKDRDVRVNLYLLGAKRDAAGALELIIYGQDKEPLAHVPLAAADGASQSFPLEITGTKQDDDTGRLTINILGKHRAELVFKRAVE